MATVATASVTDAEYSALRALAAAERRTVSWMIADLVREGLKAKGIVVDEVTA